MKGQSELHGDVETWAEMIQGRRETGGLTASNYTYDIAFS